jgi:hypothetical protein
MTKNSISENILSKELVSLEGKSNQVLVQNVSAWKNIARSGDTILKSPLSEEISNKLDLAATKRSNAVGLLAATAFAAPGYFFSPGDWIVLGGFAFGMVGAVAGRFIGRKTFTKSERLQKANLELLSNVLPHWLAARYDGLQVGPAMKHNLLRALVSGSGYGTVTTSDNKYARWEMIDRGLIITEVADPSEDSLVYGYVPTRDYNLGRRSRVKARIEKNSYEVEKQPGAATFTKPVSIQPSAVAENSPTVDIVKRANVSILDKEDTLPTVALPIKPFIAVELPDQLGDAWEVLQTKLMTVKKLTLEAEDQHYVSRAQSESKEALGVYQQLEKLDAADEEAIESFLSVLQRLTKELDSLISKEIAHLKNQLKTQQVFLESVESRILLDKDGKNQEQE